MGNARRRERELDGGGFASSLAKTVPLPGAPSGQNYISPYSPPFINDQGEVAFGASTYPNGYPPAASTDSIYEMLWSEAGGLHLVDIRLSEWDHKRYITPQGLADNGNLLYSAAATRLVSSVHFGDDPELLIEEKRA